ncbi:hypothetical protein [Clostridium felsineum]|nr:hypothetical protein [Clostridium felsineum]
MKNVLNVLDLRILIRKIKELLMNKYIGDYCNIIFNFVKNNT